MTRSNSAFVLHRMSERVSAGAAAIAVTLLMLLTVDSRASQPDPVPPSITVAYSDAAILSKAGAAKIYRKLKNAARQVCGVNQGRDLISTSVQKQECFQSALAEAVRRIDRPLLTAVHEAHSRNLG
jgi:UrcA family protein